VSTIHHRCKERHLIGGAGLALRRSSSAPHTTC
jgi:hypothetical protein